MSDVGEATWGDRHNPFGESNQERTHVKSIYEAFVCPLTKKVMQDPVTTETGYTFERTEIEKWFKDCRDNGKKTICPLTSQEIRSTNLNPCFALKNTIEEWRKRNEASQLEFVHRSLSPGNSESDILRALKHVQDICQGGKSQKHIMLAEKLVPMIALMLTNGSEDIRCQALTTLRIVAEEDRDCKGAMAAGDTIRTIVKFLSHNTSPARGEAVSLLFELSKTEYLSEKIGGVNGAVLLLVGIASSNSENVLIVQQAEKTLENMEKCEKNVFQLAENGRLQLVLKLLLEGSTETQFSMISLLGDLVLINESKVLVSQEAGSSLVGVMQTGSLQAKEAALNALLQISYYKPSAMILIEKGILPPLVRNLFSFGSNQLPMKLKEVSARVLANVVSSGADFENVLLDHNQTLVSEDIIHNLLHLISNTGPAIECKLVQVLVGLTSSPATVQNIVDAIKSSGATISLIQFIEAPQRELRMASIKLLHNISPYMNRELAEALCSTAGQLTGLTKIIFVEDSITEEQAAAVGLLAQLPERDLGLTLQLLDEETFSVIISKVQKIRQGVTHGGRFVTPYLEGLVRILSRITYALENEPSTVTFAREHNLATLFSDLLQANGLDNVQIVSALALENMSRQTEHLTRVSENPDPGFFCKIFPCLSSTQTVTGICEVHHGICSIMESFCLVEGKVMGKLIACLDHTNEKMVEAALAALCTLLEDGVDMQQGVCVLCHAEGIKPILDILVESRTENLHKRSVWAIERILRSEDIACEISSDLRISTALVEAFNHSDYQTKQIAEKALTLIDRLPIFSGIFQRTG